MLHYSCSYREGPGRKGKTMDTASELAKIIDRVDAAYMAAELEEGASLSRASMYLTLRNYQREDFAAFRKRHGDELTVQGIQAMAR